MRYRLEWYDADINQFRCPNGDKTLEYATLEEAYKRAAAGGSIWKYRIVDQLYSPELVLDVFRGGSKIVELEEKRKVKYKIWEANLAFSYCKETSWTIESLKATTNYGWVNHKFMIVKEGELEPTSKDDPRWCIAKDLTLNDTKKQYQIEARYNPAYTNKHNNRYLDWNYFETLHFDSGTIPNLFDSYEEAYIAIDKIDVIKDMYEYRVVVKEETKYTTATTEILKEQAATIFQTELTTLHNSCLDGGTLKTKEEITMPARNGFSIIVVFHPKPTRSATGDDTTPDSTIIVPRTDVIAPNESVAQMLAAKLIPDKTDLTLCQIVVNKLF